MKISICIPTFNRKDMLSKLINSIARQPHKGFEIEVCISDNASSDGTEDAIAIWREKYKLNIAYKRNKINLGPDRNFISSVDMATGDYCWLFGSDDLLADGALDRLHFFIETKADIYLCDRSEHNFDMSSVTDLHRHWLASDSSIFDVKRSEDIAAYYKKCNSLGGVFSYLSSLVIKKACWESVFHSGEFFGTSYAHVLYFLTVFSRAEGCKLHYIAEPLVMCRSDNDHFARDGITKRILIDLHGYTKMADYFYSNNRQVKSAFLSVLGRERPWLYTSLVIGKYCKDNKLLNDVAICYKKTGKPIFLTWILFSAGDAVHSLYNNKLIKKLFRRKT